MKIYVKNNIISNNTLWNTTGIKLSEEKSTGINISRNNKCINNHINYGMGGIEAGISIDDEISNDKFYRTERNGMRGSFARTIIENNVFTDTNYGWFTQPLLGNTTSQKAGGIVCFNGKAPTLIPKNEFNVFTNNTFIKSGVIFAVGQEQESGDTGGILIYTIQAIQILTSI